MDSARTKSFPRRAANISWLCPLFTIIILVSLIFSREVVPRKIIALVASGALCLIAVGLVFGIVALFGSSRQGSKGILAPAITGIIINGLLLAFVVANFVTARFRAVQQQDGKDSARGVALAAQGADTTTPIASVALVFEESGGVVAVEAEHFYKQTLTGTRAWHITSSRSAPGLKPDADPAHVAGASGGAYVEVLPDTRATHDDKLIDGENFSNKPGAMTVAHYKVNIKTPGRYYVWVRSFSTGSEDNGVHVGLNGQWPESGQRWQTVQKQKWAWDCKQRTEQVHTGVPMQLFLDIDSAGEHEIMFSLREDGFEMDKFILASDKEFTPEGTGPAVKVRAGQLPAAFDDGTG